MNSLLFSSRLFIGLLLLVCLVADATAINPDQVFIENKSGPYFVVDEENPCDYQPGAAYVAYRLCNTSGETLGSVKAELGGFDEGFELAGGQAAVLEVPALDPGFCTMLYWYVTYPCDEEESTSMTMTLTDDYPGEVSITNQMEIEESKGVGGSNCGRVNWTYYGTYLTDNGEICLDVEFHYKNVQEGRDIYFQPTSNLDFDAGCLQLTRWYVLESSIDGIEEGLGKTFHYILPEDADGTNEVYTRFYFKVNCQSLDTEFKPFTTMRGNNDDLKHCKNGDDVEFDIPGDLALPCEFIPGEEFELHLMESGNNWGMAWGDFDNDGDEDLFVTTNEIDQPNELYVNDGQGNFERVYEGIIVEELAPSLSASWADYDNDNDLDLYVANNIGYPNFLYRNEGNGNFVSIKDDPSVKETGYAHGVSWADFDKDGYLDLFVATYWETEFNQLYRNNGDGTFSPVTNNPIVNEASRSVAGVWGDYDGDGWPDLFVANLEGRPNSLYRNTGNGDFEKITDGEIVNEPSWSVGGSWGDYDNDGDLDLFVANGSEEANFLYNNNGDGTFTKVLDGEIVNDEEHSHGSAWADYDNDGDLDIFVANDVGNNALYANNGDGTFTRVFNEVTDDGGPSFGSAWADVDKDGDLDLFVANREYQDNFLYKNQRWTCHNYAFVRLIGNASNKNAIGAKIILTADINDVEVVQTREISAQTGGGTGGQNSLLAHFGLGEADLIKSIMVIWPSGYKQEILAEPVNQCIVIEEEDASEISGVVYYVEEINCDQALGAGTVPEDAQAAAYRTIADGDWDSNSTWLDGNKPPNNLNGATISIEHNVTRGGNIKLKNGAKLWVTNASLAIFDGKLDVANAGLYLQGAYLDILDKSLVVSNTSGEITARQSRIYIGDSYVNYGKDIFEFVCLDVVNGFDGKFNITTWTNVNARFSNGVFYSDYSTYELQDCKILAKNGFDVGFGITAGSNTVISAPDGYILNYFGTWTLNLSEYCAPEYVSGVSADYLPASESCGTIANNFTEGSCLNMVVQATNSSSTNNTGDENRIPIPNCRVVINPGNITVYTDENGYYSATVPLGTCEVSVHPDNSYTTVCPNPDGMVEVEVAELGLRYEDNDFGHEGDCSNPDMAVDVAITAHRVGFENLMVINYENVGLSTGTSTQLLLSLDEGITPVEASLPWNGLSATILVWDLGDLPPGDGGAIYLTYVVEETVGIDVPLDISAQLNCIEQDCNADNDITLLSALTVGGIDPNDILVSPEGGIQREQVLTYKIRFQNVGNAPAANVRIENELPEGLDLTTLEIGAASHNYQFRAEDKMLIWTFPSINLPDSLNNEPESHGFVTYRIKAKADWPLGEKILNSASIYFDNFAPIVTNVVSNFILAVPEKGGELNVLHVYPNPATTYVTAQFGQPNLLNGETTLQSLELFSPVGQLIASHTQDSGHQMQLDFGDLPPGLYTLYGIDDRGRRYMGKVVVMASE